LCALSPSSENCFLAYPYPPPNPTSLSGQLLIFDAFNLQAVTVLQAHKAPISTIQFNYDGTLIATSSDKGTVIRVFSVPSGDKLFQFRRGTYPARIFSLSFNLSNTLLSVSSDTDTVHIFRLVDERLAKDQDPNADGVVATIEKDKDKNLGKSLMSAVARTRKAAVSVVMSSYVPDSISEIWEPQRDFAFAKLPNTGGGSVSVNSVNSANVGKKRPAPSICAINENQNSKTQILMVVSADGYCYTYEVGSNGGECPLLKQF
ncbi:autophagy protein, partial [Nowakowskiella sp. JEL0078]